ncbi:hypothetical protein [Flavobacterium microcysteis]
MNERLINIEKLNFIEAHKIILQLCEDKIHLSLDDISFILNLKEKELVESFLKEYAHFHQKELLYIENFINSNLEHENKEFLSDLIYFATDFGLDISYSKILELLIIDAEDNNFLVLASLQYLNKNIKFLYIDALLENLTYIRDHEVYHQNEQLLASLILFRITHKPDYLAFVKELIEYDESNLEFFNNSIKDDMYDGKYFNIESFLGILKTGNLSLD